jgi:F0F1-type ATP synthase assembly protein I
MKKNNSDAGMRQARRQGLAYQGAFEAVFAILIAAGVGLWIDTRYETSPWGLLVGTGVGFASFVLRLLKLGRRLHEQQDPAEKDTEQ